MNLKNRFRLVIFSMVALLISIAVITAIGIRYTNVHIQQAIGMDELVVNLYGLQILNSEFVATPSERVKQQWRTKYAQIKRNLVEQQNMPDDVTDALNGLNQIFERFSSLPEAASGIDVSQKRLKDQLETTLNLESQRIIDWASDISRQTKDGIVLRLMLIDALMLAIMLIAMLVVITIILITTKHILSSVNRLKEGAEEIASGKLGFQVERTGNDEIATLTTAINQMSLGMMDSYENLQKQTVRLETEMAERQMIHEALKIKTGELEEEIGERKQAEDALQESERRFRELAELLPETVFETDMRGTLTFVNRNAFDRFGYTPEDFAGGLNALNMITPDERGRAAENMRRIMGGETVGSNEFTMQRKDESTFWAMIHSTTIIHDGKPVGLRGFIVDITMRKRAEEALLSESEFNRLVIENAGQGICVCHAIQEFPYVRFTVWNECMTSITGYSMEEINRLGWYQSMYPDPAVQERAIMRMQSMRVGDNIRGEEWEITRADGEKRQLIITTRLHPGKDDESFVLGVMTDITERKRAEEEKGLLEERLRHADKMEAIGTLTGGIAHDFNNLLMGIQGYASLMLLDLDTSHPHYEGLKRIEEQVQSGADLTKQLLGFARGGRYEVKPTDMNDLLEKSSSMFGRTKKEITIHRKFGQDLRPVEVDRGQMEQVFMNLYVNAWQAMPGGGEIYLETENVLLDDKQAVPYAISPGQYVKITVTDTGTGMDEKTKDRIFDPFFTTKGMGRGTGLGLAMVYGIIKGHGGVIHVDSKPAHGATFTIYLPASKKEAVKEKTATGSVARGTETILLVDDEKMVREVSTLMLESLGYRVYVAGSGQEAIAVYMEKRDKIDMVILDMILPGISGGETFDRLREINPDAKVLLSSGYSINGQAQEILDHGCNGFLQKPFRIANLSGKVREILD